MAENGWTARVAAAAGAAAGTGAAQLGLGYGLGVIVWPTAATTDDSVWLGSLGWATWTAASATVFGAVIGSRFRGAPAKRFRGPWRLALATSAAIGALVAVALIALPARSAVRVDTFSPQVIAGGYAVVGVALGLIVAYWAVVSRPVAANLIATAVWLWALAIAAIVVELTVHRSSATYLTSWQFAESVDGVRYGTIYWPSALLTLAAAFVVGVATAIPAARRGNLGIGTATSGGVGPLLVAAAFLALAPQLTGALGPIGSSYLIAPYAVLAGLAGSALTVSTARAAADRRNRRKAATDSTGAITATGVAAVPAADPAGLPAESPPPKTKAAATAGRVKLPTQPTADTRPPADPWPDADTNPPATTRSKADARTAADPRPTAGSRPAGEDSGRARSAASAIRPATETRPGEGTKSTPPSTSPPAQPKVARTAAAAAPSRSNTTAKVPDSQADAKTAGSADAKTAGPADAKTAGPAGGKAGDTGADRSSGGIGATAKPTAKTNGPATSEAGDPEIAAAARPARPRVKRAPSPAPPTESKSTVTPPPADPTIAKINPKPEA